MLQQWDSHLKATLATNHHLCQCDNIRGHPSWIWHCTGSSSSVEVNSTHEWASVIGCAAECGFTRSSSSGWWWLVAIHCSRLQMALTRLYYYYVDKTLFVAMTPSLVSYGLSCRHIDTYYRCKPKQCAICAWAVSSAVCGVDHSSLDGHSKKAIEVSYSRKNAVQKCNCRTVPNVSISYKICSWLTSGWTCNK